MKEVALITIHGMGEVDLYYYSKLEKELKKRLGNNWTKVSFQNVQYAPILQDPEDKLWKDIITNPNNDIDFIRLRKFFLFGFGDAGSLEYSAHGTGKIYRLVQEEIKDALDKAYIDLDDSASKPVVIIAQSLGCQVISNYLWDAEYGNYIFKNNNASNQDKQDFRELKSLMNLITTGCNIPLFNAGISDRKCFSKPNNNFIWDNYYDPDDVLGWPLEQLGSSYNIVNDHPINSGGILTSWNPLSHKGYWSDGDVIKPLVKILNNFI